MIQVISFVANRLRIESLKWCLIELQSWKIGTRAGLLL